MSRLSRPASEGPASAAARPRRSTWLLISVAGGVFVAADDQTSVVTVLPAIIPDIGISVDEFYRSSWIINGYLLGFLVALPIVGRIADVYGHARVYAGALGVFMLGSALVAVAPTFEWLVAARALQAVGGGAAIPVAMAIVVDELPVERRALGLGAIAAASESGALIGPLWSGAITEWLGWRWVFGLNLPMTVPFLVGAWLLARHRGAAGRVDWWGAALLGAALAVLTVALADDPVEPRPLWVTLLIVAVAAAIGLAFLRHQRAGMEPMVRLAMFRPTPVWTANAASLLLGGGLIAMLISVPLFVNLVLAESPLDGGLTLLRLTAAVPVGALAGGWLAGRGWGRETAVVGMWLAAAGFLVMLAWDADLSEVQRSLPQVIAGLGFGLVIAPLGAAVLEHVDEGERATAASWLTLSRVLGMLIGTSVLSTNGLGRFYARAGSIEFDSPEFDALVESAQVDTFREVFVGAAVVMVVAGLVAWGIGRTHSELASAWRSLA